MSILEKLNNMKVAELRNICKENGIQHCTKDRKFKKDELINAILKAGVFEEKKESESDSVESSAKIENKVEVKDNSVNKLRYLENIECGTIVAFNTNEGKVISAKVIKKSLSRKKLMVETSYGQQHTISWEDVIWVKTGKRWPKGIYNMFQKQVR